VASALVAGVFGWVSCATAPSATTTPREKPVASLSADGGAPALPAGAPPPSGPAPAAVSFEERIRPILEARCRPCHFPGGKMYARLPFDCPQTVRLLGTKLFTRIRDDGDRAAIRLFLAQSPSLDGEVPEHCRLIGRTFNLLGPEPKGPGAGRNQDR
jgi:hypothetical protein